VILLLSDGREVDRLPVSQYAYQTAAERVLHGKLEGRKKTVVARADDDRPFDSALIAA
jgi:hypothetical protein